MGGNGEVAGAKASLRCFPMESHLIGVLMVSLSLTPVKLHSERPARKKTFSCSWECLLLVKARMVPIG